MPHHLDEQARTIALILEEIREKGLGRVEATEDAEKAWVDGIINDGQKVSLPGQDPCTPGYYNNEGTIDEKWAVTLEHSRVGPPRYFKKLKAWREDGNFDGINFG